MIIKKEDREVKVVENLKGGEGFVKMNTIVNSDKTFDHAKMYSTLSFKKGCGIGYHNHIDEAEIIIIEKGIASCKDDEKEYKAYPGDIVICEEGHFHSIRNDEDEELVVNALVIKKC